jgi:hypothetical protein
MAKPTGIGGPLKLGVEADGTAQKEFLQVKYPSDKSDIEKLIAGAFVNSIATVPGPNGQTLHMSELQQNVEDDFDFTVTTGDGLAYLELLEAAPLRGPYEKASPQYMPYDYAQKMLAHIGEKAFRYPFSGVKKIYLLIYVTHWAFIFSESTINCLRYWLAVLPSPFTGIFLYMPITEAEGITEWLYPSDLPPEFHPSHVVGRIVTNMDPRSVQATRDNDGGVGFVFPAVKP